MISVVMVATQGNTAPSRRQERWDDRDRAVLPANFITRFPESATVRSPACFRGVHGWHRWSSHAAQNRWFQTHPNPKETRWLKPPFPSLT